MSLTRKHDQSVSAFVIGAPSSGAGKTITTLGLIAAFKKLGLSVGSAKVGPDYIDPCFHQAANAGRPCYNLDGWAMRQELITNLANHIFTDSDITIIEGVMGLYDGTCGGEGSTAELAKCLNLPIVLVIDAGRAAQSVAAIALGFSLFDPNVKIAGVIFTHVASPRHEAMLRDAMAMTDIPVFGAIQKDKALSLPSRHLGLIQAREQEALSDLIEHAAERVASDVDLSSLYDATRLAATHPIVMGNVESRGFTPLPPLAQRIAIAQDVAFAFSYPHLIEYWRSFGAEIHFFSPLKNEAPAKNCDAIYLPGGYPELYASQIASAEKFHNAMRTHAEAGTLIYGECGGYMVLGEGLIDAYGKHYKMLGLLPITTSFAEPRLSLGYRHLQHTGTLPWPKKLRGHEFHYSCQQQKTFSKQDIKGQGLFQAEDTNGFTRGTIGSIVGRVMGSYAHVIDCECIDSITNDEKVMT